MRRFLHDRGVTFRERDVTNPGYMEELLAHTGGVRGTPVIVIGQQVLRGFDRGRLMRLLGIERGDASHAPRGLP